MACHIGLELMAVEPRIAAGVLGLVGLPDDPSGLRLAEHAARISRPVLYLLQADDALVNLQNGMQLFLKSGRPTSRRT